MADSDTVKALLYVCLAGIGFLITVTSFFIYTLVFRVKRQFVYHIRLSDSTPHLYTTEDENVTGSSGTAGHAETTGNQGTTDDDKDTDSLTRNLSFRKFERPEQPDKSTHQETTENLDTTEQPETVEHPQTTEDTDDSKDKDSLTRGLSFSKFERPEQPDKSTHYESTENLDTTEQPETVEHPQTTEDTDDSKDKDSFTRGLSFSNFERLIEYAGTFGHSESTEHPETTEGHPGIQGNPDTTDLDRLTREMSISNNRQPETTEHPDTTGHLEFSENLKTLATANAGIMENPNYTTENTNDAYSLTRVMPTNNHQQPEFTVDTDITRHQNVSENLEANGSNGDPEITENANTYEATDNTTTADSFTHGILNNNHQPGQPDNTSHLKTTGNANVYQGTDDTKDTDSLGIISFSSHQQRGEKKVTFSGNDSTYIVETKGKTVQLAEFDETSNFEFVKFIKQQQKKT